MADLSTPTKVDFTKASTFFREKARSRNSPITFNTTATTNSKSTLAQTLLQLKQAKRLNDQQKGIKDSETSECNDPVSSRFAKKM
jgi:hypothetical protein